MTEEEAMAGATWCLGCCVPMNAEERAAFAKQWDEAAKKIDGYEEGYNLVLSMTPEGGLKWLKMISS